MKKLLIFAIIIGGAFWGFKQLSKHGFTLKPIGNKAVMKISSPVFTQNGIIPIQYTCDGQNVNPPLSIGNIPADTASLALVVDEPDAANGTYTHWVIYNMPAKSVEIAENSKPSGSIARNSANTNKYTGPCPAEGSGEHRYHFRVYAINKPISDGSVFDRRGLEAYIAGNIIDKVEIVGRYTR